MDGARVLRLPLLLMFANHGGGGGERDPGGSNMSIDGELRTAPRRFAGHSGAECEFWRGKIQRAVGV